MTPRPLRPQQHIGPFSFFMRRGRVANRRSAVSAPREKRERGTGVRVLTYRSIALSFILMFLAAVCPAKPQFLIVFNNTYHPDQSSPLGEAKCGICHTTPPHRNPYGKDLKKLVDGSPDGMLTSAMLKAVEGLDSDGDGYTNGEEIAQGFLPGDPSNHPSKHGGMPKSFGSSRAESPLIPSHAYHPAFVHFPIALFLFAVLLEYLGIRRKDSALGTAAVWNLHGALASMAIVVPTGIAAWLLGGHKLEGAMLYHMICAGGGGVFMIVTIMSRKRYGNTSRAYWFEMILCAILICAAGYFGGQMVYG